MRRPYVAGNWKMHGTVREAAELAGGLAAQIGQIDNIDVALCPPYTALSTVSEAIRGSRLRLGAQDLHWEKSGAFTGEVSAGMLVDAGCHCVIIGHSERRQFFGETEESVNRKLKSAVAAGLEAIVCVGETLVEREGGSTLGVVERQLAGGLEGAGCDLLTIAYEPVWAIGTGKVASPEQAQEVHGFIRAWLGRRYGAAAGGIRILYGGSVKPDNIVSLSAQPDIDGALVGGASLKVDSFSDIVRGSLKRI
ncbi:MAG: triose-phosphate isomerase [Acidobacteria bacterium]|nr:triose-phosphate isomerase [Acidobacteriota bacterium]